MEENNRVSKLELAELLICCFFFAGKEPDGWFRVDENTLGAALKSARKRGAFPPWGKKNLHFASGRAGIVCIELAELLNLAAECLLLEFDSSFRRAKVTISRRIFQGFLADLEIGEKKARRWGRFIKEGLEEQ